MIRRFSASVARLAPTARIGQRTVAALGRHRRPLEIGAGVSAVAAAVFGATVALSGASARADAPPASDGRLLQVVVETRHAQDPAPAVAYSLLPTLSSAPAADISTDPDLAGAQAAAEVQAYLDREAREQSATLAALARSDAQAAQALREAPVWPEPPAPVAETVATPGA